ALQCESPDQKRNRCPLVQRGANRGKDFSGCGHPLAIFSKLREHGNKRFKGFWRHSLVTPTNHELVVLIFALELIWFGAEINSIGEKRFLSAPSKDFPAVANLFPQPRFAARAVIEQSGIALGQRFLVVSANIAWITGQEW